MDLDLQESPKAHNAKHVEPSEKIEPDRHEDLSVDKPKVLKGGLRK